MSKKATVLSTYSRLNSRESSRRKIAGPVRRPISYPETLPANAATVSAMQATQSGVLITPVPMSSPTVNSSESPGRKNPSSSPHSANTMAREPHSAHGPSVSSQYVASIQEGRATSECTRPA